MNMIIKDLSVGYDENIIIERISLEIKRGKIVVLIGPNGAGKSTVLKTVAGMLEPLKGEILIENDFDFGKKSEYTLVSRMSPNARAKKLASMLTNRFSTEYMTVEDVVSGGRFPYTNLLGKLTDEDIVEIDKALNIVGALDKKYNDFNKLSDGQKQRVLLARAIAQKPEYMILDEPTSYLDIGYKLSFIETLKELSSNKDIGILMSLHELEMAVKIADLVVCITKDGRIDKIAPPEEVFLSPYIEDLFEVKKGTLRDTYNFNIFKNPVSEVKEKLSKPSAHFLMIQGTMSSAGKSLIVAGLCRIFKQDGYRVAPFKSQNMALNSFVTDDGLEMGRAQVMQAEASKINPSVYMNPILLKPTSDRGSQVIVNGQVRCNMSAKEYFEYKTSLVPDILAAVEKLQENTDIIVIEGAGSPAEINLKNNDIVNMGMAKMVDAPVLLVGDIDRGGVFAQLLGTLELLDKEEKDRVKGLIVNKFRGDKSILDSGLKMLEDRSQVPVTGVIPYMHLNLEDEDSLSCKFQNKEESPVKIGVIKLPHISNFTDFDVFSQINIVSVHYINSINNVEDMDLIILPGSKNTIADMKWLKETGLESVIKKYSALGKPVFGICGGYQMLGEKISDPQCAEGGGTITGIGLLPVETVLGASKIQCQVSGKIMNSSGIFKSLFGQEYEGYEIHMGQTTPISNDVSEFTQNGSGYCKNNVWGSYIHGLFDQASIAKEIVSILAKEKGIDAELSSVVDYRILKEKEYDKLADIMRENIDMDYIYSIIGVDR